MEVEVVVVLVCGWLSGRGIRSGGGGELGAIKNPREYELNQH